MEYIQDSIHNGVGQIILDRPSKHNAFNQQLILEFISTLEQFNNNPDVHVIIVRSNGKNFCAGADIDYMRSMAGFTEQENIDDAQQLAALFGQLYHCSKPTIALVQGWALGGGIGLMCSCDFVIATSDAQFCFSEVRLGLIPATISPFVVRKIGADAAKRYFMTADTLNIKTALQTNLVNQECDRDSLEANGLELAETLRSNAPNAVKACKHLVHQLDPIAPEVQTLTTTLIAKTRQSEEAQRGLKAFLDNTAPKWNA
jgi:methylglutaconyl-CoA hydratase